MVVHHKTVTAKRYHHGNLRQGLIEAAWIILETKGADSLSLREVARQAGVSHAAPYRHFEDKAALLAAVAETALIKFEQSLRAVNTQSNSNPAECLQLTSVAYVNYALDHPTQYRLIFSCASASTASKKYIFYKNKLNSDLDAASDRLLKVLVDIILAGQLVGQFKAGDAFSLAFGKLAFLHGLVMLILDSKLYVAREEALTLAGTIIASMMA